jgi:hypothetical protein
LLQLFIYDTCYPCRTSPSSLLCASRNLFSPVKWLGRTYTFNPAVSVDFIDRFTQAQVLSTPCASHTSNRMEPRGIEPLCCSHFNPLSSTPKLFSGFYVIIITVVITTDNPSITFSFTLPINSVVWLKSIISVVQGNHVQTFVLAWFI